MEFRFLKDRHNNKLHIWNRHGLTQKEVISAFPNKMKEYKDGNAFVRTSKTLNAGLMEIVYIRNPDHYFIITAYYI